MSRPPIHGSAEVACLSGAPGPGPGRRDEKLALEPPELGWLLAGGTLTDHVRPRLLLWPRLALATATATAAPSESVPAAAVRQALLDARFSRPNPGANISAHIDDGTIERLPADAPRPVSAPLHDVIDTTVPCYRVAVTSDPPTLAA